MAGACALFALAAATLPGQHVAAASAATSASDTSAAVALLAHPVSIRLDRVALRHAVDLLAARAGAHVQYRADLLDAFRLRVTVEVTNIPLRAAFAKILAGTGMQVVPLPGALLNIETARTPAHVVDGDITGVVRDARSGQPVSGVIVSVIVGSRTYSTSTSVDGRFSLTGLAAGKYTVIVRRLGYLVQEKRADVRDGEAANLVFSINAVPVSLQEVVTTGAGERQKLEIGNSISTINADSLVKITPIRNLSDLLKGRAAGVTVSPMSGTVGTGSRIRIRGLSSMLTSEDPVVIVDGVRVDAAFTRSSFNQTIASNGLVLTPSQNVASTKYTPASSRLDDIDPENIESLDILKGPAASALYGSDAANGVIVIKTKRGRPGTMRWSLSAQASTSKIRGTFAENYYGWGTQYGVSTVSSCTLIMVATEQCTQDSISHFNPLNSASTSPFIRGHAHKYNAQVSGGSNQVQYFLGATYDDEQGGIKLPDALIAPTMAQLNGIALPSWSKKPNLLSATGATGNVTTQLGTTADVALSVNARHQYHRAVPEGVFGFINNSISGPGYMDTVRFGWGSTTPASTFLMRTDDEVSRGYGSLAGNWRPANMIQVHATLGADYGVTNAGTFLGAQYVVGIYPADHSERNRNQQTNVIKTGDLNATFETPITNTIQLRSTVGGQYVGSSANALSVNARDLPLGGTTGNNAGTITTYEYNAKQVTAGWYIQETGSFNQRLFITGALRADASSAFGARGKAVAYPKWNASWLISQEPFFPRIPGLSMVRLRVGYGHAGAQPPFDARFKTYNYQSGYANGATANAIGLSTPGNPDLLPERSVETEGGIDLSFGDDRVTVEGTMINKITRDALVNRALPGSFGGLSQMENIGEIRNRGFELSSTLRPIVSNAVAWNATFLLSRTWNTLISLGAATPSPDFTSSWAGPRYVPGYPVDGLWVRAIVGYSDANENGVIEPGEIKVTDNSVFAGHTSPSATLAWQNNVAFANGRITVGANFTYSGGATQYNSLGVNQCQNGYCRGSVDPTATLAQQVLAAAGQQITDWPFLERVSTFRFEELSLTLRAPAAIARALRSPNATVSLMGRNLKFWSRYRGVDPDVNTTHQPGDETVDQGGVPQPRTWTLRINLGY
jgi:TonB-linked SusC/RagA family outer membrane protein